jgi:DNA-binding transcriptional MerR regulator
MALRGNARPNSPQKVNAALRRQQIVRLRGAGASMEAIRQQLGLSVAGVYKAYHVALDEQRESLADDLREQRQLQAMRLDEMLFALWPSVQRGDTHAIGKAIAIEARRAKLLGLDAPTQTTVSGWVRASDATVAEGIATAIASATDDLGEPSLSNLTDDELTRLYQRLKGTRAEL